MLNFPSEVKIFVAVEPCDMRKQFDGLAACVENGMQRDPRSGDIFVFHNRRADMLKVLFFDQQGYCLLAKRMDRGTFKFLLPETHGTPQITPQELAELMRGAPMRRAA